MEEHKPKPRGAHQLTNFLDFPVTGLEARSKRAPTRSMMRNLAIAVAAFSILPLLSGCARQAYYYSPYPYYYSPYPQYSPPPSAEYPPSTPEYSPGTPEYSPEPPYGDAPDPYTGYYRGGPYRQ
jgi:hypothetical protein